jgi:hypothetical protein
MVLIIFGFGAAGALGFSRSRLTPESLGVVVKVSIECKSDYREVIPQSMADPATITWRLWYCDVLNRGLT